MSNLKKATNAERAKGKEKNMTTYTDELKVELDRVTLRGSPDKQTFAKLASIIWRMDQRIQALEEQVVLDDKPAKKTTTKKKDD